MAVAFSKEEANFTLINSDGHLFITKVKHKTFIDVNEEDTGAILFAGKVENPLSAN